jgi:hypothetical protein
MHGNNSSRLLPMSFLFPPVVATCVQFARSLSKLHAVELLADVSRVFNEVVK